MTVGSGLFIAESEKSTVRQNQIMRQLIEGRSNAVGTVTLTDDGATTSTTVTAPTCGPNSVVFMFPMTSHAASALSGTYVDASDITPGQFVVTHAATSNSDVTFAWVCLG